MGWVAVRVCPLCGAAEMKMCGSSCLDTAVHLRKAKGSVEQSYIWEIVSESRSSLGKREDRVEAETRKLQGTHTQGWGL